MQIVKTIKKFDEFADSVKDQLDGEIHAENIPQHWHNVFQEGLTPFEAFVISRELIKRKVIVMYHKTKIMRL